MTIQDSGFDYHLDLEQIIAYKKLTPEQKLQWLGEIFEFTEAALSPKARRVRELLRGESSLSANWHLEK